MTNPIPPLPVRLVELIRQAENLIFNATAASLDSESNATKANLVSVLAAVKSDLQAIQQGSSDQANAARADLYAIAAKCSIPENALPTWKPSAPFQTAPRPKAQAPKGVTPISAVPAGILRHDFTGMTTTERKKVDPIFARLF